VIFLVVSALVALAILWASAEVLLPFIVALAVAYVLTPLVAKLEALRVPRAAAIILVYIFTFGGLYLSIAAIAPRVIEESAALTRELPVTAKRLAAEKGPRVEGWVRDLLPKSEPRPEGPPPPAIEVTKRADGSFAIDVKSGVELVQEGEKRWRVLPASDEPGEFSIKRALDGGIEQTVAYVKRNALEIVKVGQLIVSRISRGIFLLFMTLMVAGYLMYTREDVLGFFRSLPPIGARPSFDRLLQRIDKGMSGVVRGQLLICLVNGVLSAIGFALFGLKYWPIIAIIAGVGSIIPIFGSILSTIPAVAIGLTQNFFTAFAVLIWIIGIHQVEANFLNPKIIGTAAKIHPVLVVFSLIVGEHFHGLWGALFAVPVLSLLQSLFQHFRYESMPDMPPDSLLPTPPRRRATDDPLDEGG
jgi:predicted PurR-regulated permease PerM